MYKTRKLGALCSIFLILVSLLVFPAGCRHVDPMEKANIYIDHWAALNFEGMYDVLSHDSQEYISKEAFVDRYKTIFSAIEVSSIEIVPQEIIKEAENAYLPIDVVFNTDTVGSFETRYMLPLVLEDEVWKILWTPSLIFPDLEDEDQVRLVSQHALRGSITDREDNPIVIEGEAYTVGGVPGKIPDQREFAKALAPLLEISEQKILDELSRDWVKDDTLVPLRNFPLSISGEFKEELLSIQGVMLVTNIVTDSRRYLNNELYSHIVGYVQRANAEDLEERPGYKENDLIGRQGIEASMEEELRGASGYSLFIRDKDNQKKSTIAERAARDGNTISLTLDPQLQEIAHTALQGHVGTAVTLDGLTGEVLAMVSYPDYNPNVFPNGVPSSIWEELSEDPDKPFINRSTYALYPPGSAIKPFYAAMALEEGVINPNTVVEAAQKRSWIPSLNDWNAPPITRTKHPEGPVNLDRALVWSDNIFFAWAALKLPYDTFESYSERYGMGQPLPFDIPVSKSLVKREDTPWSKHLLANSAFGQGEMLITPLQLASMYTAFLNQGDILLPQIIREIKTSEDETIRQFERQIWRPEAIPQKWIDIILPSLYSVVEDKTGTAHSMAIDGLKIAAKTGTAQKDDEGENEIGWIAAFTPETPNPLVIVVTLEVPAGEGGVRLDIAKAILEEYYGIAPAEDSDTDSETDSEADSETDQELDSDE